MARPISAVVASLSLILAAAAAAQAPVIGSSTADPGEIVVRGYPPHCHPRTGDPQDEVDLSAAAAAPQQQQVIRVDPVTGKLGLFPDDYPPTAPDVWQRSGTRMNEYVFRVPPDANPLCIGSRNRLSAGVVQLRRAFEARPYWGKVMRFTAYVATRKVGEVSFWIASGTGQYKVGRKVKLGSNIIISGHFPPTPIRGDHEWMPISYTIGPLPCGGTQISYGVTLAGGGDVWLYQPRFEEVSAREISRHLLHGKAFLRRDPICRHFLNDAKVGNPGRAAQMRDESQLAPPQ